MYDLSNGSITNDLEWFQGHIVTIWIDALDIGLLCAQLSRDVFATAKFLLQYC